MENCHRKLKQTNKNVSFDKNRKGLILKIGNRNIVSTSLKFEYEMKGRFLIGYQIVWKNLNYLDWLVVKLRPTDNRFSARLLQFFVYVQNLNYEIDSLGIDGSGFFKIHKRI